MQIGFRVNTSFRAKVSVILALALTVCTALTWAASEKESANVVDSGTFAVLMNGKRVASETFSIHQGASGSSVISRFRTEAEATPSEQSSELQLTPAGELKSYEWKEISPGQSHATVVPNQGFLMERYSSGADSKPQEQPFLLPASTNILDDYFFVQREVLAWKYLQTSCKQEKGSIDCPLKVRAQMGTLNAHARASALVSLQFSGREKVRINGTDRDLIRLDLKSETGDWTMWLDDQLKLQRMTDEGNTTEVVRE